MRKQNSTSIESLREEKAELEEEVRQLRAAILMYTEVARRLAAQAQLPLAVESSRPQRLPAAA